MITSLLIDLEDNLSINHTERLDKQVALLSLTFKASNIDHILSLFGKEFDFLSLFGET